MSRNRILDEAQGQYLYFLDSDDNIEPDTIVCLVEKAIADRADVVYGSLDMIDLVNALDLSHATMTNIKENLFWALFYNAICIPVACGVFYPLWGWKLSPMLGALAMSFSSVFVVSNALRLRWFKVKKESVKRNEHVINTDVSPILGGDGNKEFLLHLQLQNAD